MKKLYLVLMVFALCPIISWAETITIDNDFSDWEDIASLAVGTENITGQDYWDVSGSWSTTNPDDDTLIVNQEKMLDILDFKMTNDNENLYVMMQAVYPFLMAKDEATGVFYPFGYPLTYDPVTGQPLTFVPDAPADFDHFMVLSFDVNSDDQFDYFGAMNFSWAAGSGGEDAMTIVRTIYQDDGDGIFTPDTDTVLSSVTNPEETVSAEVMLEAGEGMTENRIEVSQPMDDEGLSFLQIGETVLVRLETHSDIGDYTDTAEYTIQGDIIDQNALIVGTGKAGKKFKRGVVTAYDMASLEELLTINAYNRKIGAKVAVGNIYESEQPEIITIPLKKFKKPLLKFFTITGEIGNSQRVFSRHVKRAVRYDLDVGDVNDDSVNEIILSAAFRNKIYFVVYQLNEEEGRLEKLADVAKNIDGYNNGVWVAVANVDTADDEFEILTSPRQGDARVDLWKFSADDIEYVANASYSGEDNYANGAIIDAAGKKIYSYLQISGGYLASYAYDADSLFNLDEIMATGVGRIGEMCKADDYLAVSARNKRKVYLYENGAKAESISVSSKGAPVDYLELSE